MARCSCGNQTCSCVIVAGEGVEVSGVGSPTRPYEISSLLADLSSVLTTQSTPTLQLQHTGTGTPSNKFTIFGAAIQKLSTLVDVNDPTGPVNGDVPVWVTDHWEFRPPPTTPPGAISTANGISGDGTLNTPVSARTSGVWGTAPLNLFGSDPSVGEAIYIDGSGNLRGRGHSLAVDSHPSTDLHSSYPVGLTLMDVSLSYGGANGWIGTSNVLTVRRNDGTGASQWHSVQSTTGYLRWRRSLADNSWGPWIDSARTPLPNPIQTSVTTTIDITTVTEAEPATKIRVSITNPHPQRRMLVAIEGEGITQQINGISNSQVMFAGLASVSGSPVNVGAVMTWRQSVPPNDASVGVSHWVSSYYYVPAGGTCTWGGTWWKTNSSATVQTRNNLLTAIPLRYEEV